MHSPEVRAEALRMVEAGLNDCEIARRTGIPRRTILDWRRPTYIPRRETPVETCPRCWRAAKRMRFTAEDYSELLGLYLGDGCISNGPRAHRLRIALDAKYPRVIEDARASCPLFPGEFGRRHHDKSHERTGLRTAVGRCVLTSRTHLRDGLELCQFASFQCRGLGSSCRYQRRSAQFPRRN